MLSQVSSLERDFIDTFSIFTGWVLNAKRLSLVTKEAINIKDDSHTPKKKIKDDCTKVLQSFKFFGKVLFCADERK